MNSENMVHIQVEQTIKKNEMTNVLEIGGFRHIIISEVTIQTQRVKCSPLFSLTHILVIKEDRLQS